jgi:hypothetical protein
VIPPLRSPERQNAARGKGRAASVGMTTAHDHRITPESIRTRPNKGKRMATSTASAKMSPRRSQNHGALRNNRCVLFSPDLRGEKSQADRNTRARLNGRSRAMRRIGCVGGAGSMTPGVRLSMTIKRAPDRKIPDKMRAMNPPRRFKICIDVMIIVLNLKCRKRDDSRN